MSSDGIKIALRCSKLKFVAMQHFHMGLFIRNNFASRSKKGLELRADIHKKGGSAFSPDAMSSYLVGEVWEHIHKNYGNSNPEKIKGDDS